jgi:hypothetical protein
MNKYKVFSKIWFLALLLVTFVAGCASNGAEVNPGALLNVVVTPQQASVPVTGTQQYTVTAIYSNGSSQDVTAASTWSAVNVPVGGTAVATVSSAVPTKGLATAKVVGTSTITATFQGITKTATLTVNAATATKFEVKPTAYSIPVTGTQKFTAIETFSDGTSFDRTALSTWSAANLPLGGPAVATIGVNTGIATGASVGTSTITATYAASPLSPATATLNVNAATSLWFKVTPAVASTPVTGTQQYTAIETFSDGSTIDRTAAAAWSSANNTVAIVSSTAPTKGLATGKAVGTVNITATYLTNTSTAALTVNAATAVSLKVTPALASIPATGTQQYTVIETFSDGSTVDRTAASTWSAPGLAGGVAVATINATGIATGKVTGSTSIIATYGSSPFSPASATLTVNGATPASFIVTPVTATITINGGSQQYAAIETFSDGSTADRTLLSNWTATDLTGTGVATIVSTTGVATGAALGTSTITATYTVGSVIQTNSAILTVTAPNPGTAGGAPNLGLAETYGIIAHEAITSSSSLSHIYGDVATTTATSSSVTGPNFTDGAAALPNKTSSGVTNSNGVSPGIIDSSDNGNSTSLAQLQIDLNAAYIDLSTRAAATIYPAGAYELSGKIILPGVHRVGTMVPADTFALSVIAGPLVLDAQGNPDAVFVLQAGTITTTTGSVVLQGGAQAKNVFWVVFSDATIGNGASTFFQGTIVAGNTITVGLNTSVQGRMLAGALGAGSITNSGVITVPK